MRDDATVVERGSEAVLTGIRSAREQRQRERHADAMGRVYEGQRSGGAWREWMEWKELIAFHVIELGLVGLPMLELVIRRRRERKRKEREEREREERKEGENEEKKEGESQERRRHARDWNIT